MPNLLATIQSIAVNAVNSTNPISFVFGTVTSASPLKIRMDQSTINLEGDSLILTASVIEKKLVINKHSHTEDESLVDYTATGNMGAPIIFVPSGMELYVVNLNFNPNEPRTDTDDAKGTGSNPKYIVNPAIPNPQVLPLKHAHAIHDTVVDAYVYEEGKDDDDHKLLVEKDDERIVVTVNRALQKNDKVVMLRVCGGQRFIVLSRVFEEA
jgi:hypothetical protein